MKAPLVSILVVTHNAERYIEATLKSCLAQTYKPVEILVLDNASIDGTRSIIQRFEHQGVRLHTQSVNVGPYQGLNILFDIAQGDYLAIQDHDDLWRPEKVNQQVAWLEQHPEYQAVGTRTYYYYEGRGVLIAQPNPLQTDFVDHTSLLFRKSSIRYNPSHPLPDEHFERVLLRQRGRLACLQDILTIHRIRADQQNFSSTRSRFSLRTAWAHLQLTHYKDSIGTLALLLSSFLPSEILWWTRRRLTLRQADWITADEFTQKYQMPLT